MASMLILIIETSSEKGALILTDKDAPIASQILPGGPALSKCLALEVKNFLGGRIPNLIAVGTGPGSYTGIRVGAALAKGLAYGWGIPLIGFCSTASPALVYQQFLEEGETPLKWVYLEENGADALKWSLFNPTKRLLENAKCKGTHR